MQVFTTILVTLLCTSVVLGKYKALSDEYIDAINSQQSSWVAGRNFHENEFTKESIKRYVCSVLPISKDSLRKLNLGKAPVTDDGADIPESFDARENWANCPSISKVFNQGACSASWAVAAVSAMSDRICIHSNNSINVDLSAEDLLSCCPKCGLGCFAGFPIFGWNYWNTNGIVSGGPYNSKEGCKSYTLEPCGHYNTSALTLCTDISNVTEIPQCSRTCDEGSSINYNDDIHFGQAPYQIYPEEKSLKLEILNNGPVQTTFNVYEDFLSYKSGVYVKINGSGYIGESAAKIIGWGIENDQSYWLAVNTWGSDWGDNGVFKFLVGQNEDDLVTQAIAAMPNFNRDEN